MNNYLDERCFKLFTSRVSIDEFNCASFQEVNEFARHLAPVFEEASRSAYQQGHIVRLGLVGDKGDGKTHLAHQLLGTRNGKAIYEAKNYGEYLGFHDGFANVCHVDLGYPIKGLITADYRKFSDHHSPHIPDYPKDKNRTELHIVEHPDSMNWNIPHFDMAVGILAAEAEGNEETIMKVLVTDAVAASKTYQTFSKNCQHLLR